MKLTNVGLPIFHKYRRIVLMQYTKDADCDLVIDIDDCNSSLYSIETIAKDLVTEKKTCTGARIWQMVVQQTIFGLFV